MTDHEPLNGHYTAVLDRFEGTLAVLIVEEDGDVITDYHVPKAELPADGRHQDAVFHLEFDTDDLQGISCDPDQTETRKESAQDRFDRLSSRLPRDDES